MQTSWQKHAAKNAHHLQDLVTGRCKSLLVHFCAGKVYIRSFYKFQHRPENFAEQYLVTKRIRTLN